MQLADIVPWGRSFSEYQAMFDLSEADLRSGILGCGDGPASFNCEATAMGFRVVSVDPIYAFPAAVIRKRVEETHDVIISQVKHEPDRYHWTHFKDPEALGKARLDAMRKFNADLGGGFAQGRYCCAALPELPFADDAFHLSLCSHLLFLYAGQLSLDFHRASLRELLRVSEEVRVFPLLDLDCRISAYTDPVASELRDEGHTVEISLVPYEFQKGANQMLRIRRRRKKG
jgi:hypothetical protein